jgi:multiple sugar transport system permease protein
MRAAVQRFHDVPKYIYYVFVFFFFFGPISWLVLASINANPSSGWAIPDQVTLNNYVQLVQESDVGLWLRNSTILAVGTMAVTIVLATLAAYPMSRVPFRGKAVLMYSLLLARVMPVTAVIIPIFSMSVQLGLVNTFHGAILILAALQMPISLWIMKGFVDSIPIELEEAAWLDGCNRLSGLYYVVFPLMSPGVAVTGLFAFLAAWGDFIIPLVILRSPTTFPIAMGLYRAFGQQGAVDFGFLTALAVIYSAPSILLYIFSRQYLVKGMTAGSVKI